MKNKLTLFVTLAMVFLLVGISNAADSYYNGDVTINESFESITYTWTSSLWGADTTGSLHSPPIYIGDCSAVDGFISGVTANVSGTEDVDIIVHVGDKLAWTSITTGLVQLTGATAQNDTLGTTNGTDDLAFHINPWLVIEAAGQDGNPPTTYVTIKLVLRKSYSGLIYNNQPITVGSVQNKAKVGDTNP